MKTMLKFRILCAGAIIPILASTSPAFAQWNSDPSIWNQGVSSEIWKTGQSNTTTDKHYGGLNQDSSTNGNSQTYVEGGSNMNGGQAPYIDQFGLPHPGTVMFHGTAITIMPQIPKRTYAYVPPPPRAADDGAAPGTPMQTNTAAMTEKQVQKMVKGQLPSQQQQDDNQ